MPYLLWDASGLAKRYLPETGAATVAALWQAVPLTQMAVTFMGYAETLSILLRKHRRGEISPSTLAASRSLLQSDTLHSLDFSLLAVDTTDILGGLSFMDRYSLNSSDAAILATFLRHAPTTSETCVVVSADGRLVRASIAEGLKALNPALVPSADVPALLASL